MLYIGFSAKRKNRCAKMKNKNSQSFCFKLFRKKAKFSRNRKCVNFAKKNGNYAIKHENFAKNTDFLKTNANFSEKVAKLH